MQNDDTCIMMLTSVNPDCPDKTILKVNESQFQFFHWLKHRGYLASEAYDLQPALILTPSDGVQL